MKKVDYIIVGDGYAALFFAHQLIKNNKTFALFSEGKKSASQVSAGIINPVVLKRFSSFWLAKEQIQFLKTTLEEIEQYTNVNYFIDSPIHRIFHDEQEKELWLKKSKSDNLSPFLSENFDHIIGVKNDLDSGKVFMSGRLDVNGFFSGLLSFLKKEGYLVQERFNYSLVDKDNSVYDNLQFNNIVFCEGIGVKENPFFCDIPVTPNKGHHIKVQLSTYLPQDFTIKKKHFLFPIDNGLYFYGGTYERNQFHQYIDESSVEELKNGLSSIYTDKFEVKEINFGFRPTVSDRRPIIGRHYEVKNFYVFNGLGARGILNSCYFSENLFNYIEKNVPLIEEVSIDRSFK